MQAEIRSVKRNRIVRTGEGFLDVTVDFTENGAVLETRKFGYPLETTTEDIKEDLAKAVTTLEAEREQKVIQDEVDALDEQVDNTLSELEGETVDATFKRSKKKASK